MRSFHELPASGKRFGVRRQAKRDAAFELPTLLTPHQNAAASFVGREGKTASVSDANFLNSIGSAD
jgi:hypothetical protein